MSESNPDNTLTSQNAPAAPEPAPTPEPAPEPVAGEAAPEAPPAAPEPTEAEKAAKAREDKRQADISKRINSLTRRGADAERRAEAAERELAALKSLREAAQGNAPPDAAPQTPAQPSMTDQAIRAAAQELNAAQRIQERTRDLVQAGAKELGADSWNEKTNILAEMGATQNPAFMQALAELPDGHKLVAHLADDLDGLQGLLSKQPVSMAAEMGRMLAQITTTTPRTLSAAPKPAPSQQARAVSTPDAYDPKLSMAEYVALRRKNAPVHLGGDRKKG